MSQTKLARQRPTSAAPVGHWQAGQWRANSEATLRAVPDPLEGYDSRFSVGDDDNAPVVLSSSPMPSAPRNWSSHESKGRPRSAVRPQLRSSAQSAQEQAFMSWRELMAEMLGDVTQDIIENMGQEFVNAIRVMRRDFDRAVSRVSEEVRSSQQPTTQAIGQGIGQCTSTLLSELERGLHELHEAVQFHHVETAHAIRDNRADLERVMIAVQDTKMASVAEVNLEPVLQAIRKSKVDLTQAVQERCTSADLQAFAQSMPRPTDVQLEPVLKAIQEIDLSPLISALDEKRLDADLTDLVKAISEVANGVHALSLSKQEVELKQHQQELKQALRDKITTETLQSIHEACKDLHGEVQESRTQVLSAVSQSDGQA